MKTVNQGGSEAITPDLDQAIVSSGRRALATSSSARGRTLYLFTSDKDTNSTCYEGCEDTGLL